MLFFMTVFFNHNGHDRMHNGHYYSFVSIVKTIVSIVVKHNTPYSCQRGDL